MNGRIALLLLVVIGCALSASLNKGSTGFNRKRWLIHGRPWHGLVPPPAEDASTPPASQWFTQKLDHFTETDERTYQQQYWYNDQWYQPGGPIFLMLGGEGPESGSWVVNEKLEWLTLAKKFNAMVFLIEHRFYGKSMPAGFTYADEDLVYLSSRQALADMASFIKGMNKVHGFNSPKWIVFGGSYSGALAAWAREKYPELVYGSLASSAPIQAEVDFYQYLEVVKFAFSQTDQTCADNIHKGFQKLQALEKTAAGRQTLKSLMNLCQDIDPAVYGNEYTFWQSMIGNYMGVVQYGGDNAGNYRSEVNPKAVCDIINQSSDNILNAMAYVNNFFMEQNMEDCVDIDYQGYLDYMKDPHNDRSWFWQTCTEFGYYQSTDSKTAGPFFGDKTKSFMPIDKLVKECQLIFGDVYNSDAVYEAVKKTNAFYGGTGAFNATRVIFPNGNHDPWHALGELKSPNPSSPAIIIDGTAHCADMYTYADSDLPSLKKARKAISAHMASWVFH